MKVAGRGVEIKKMRNLQENRQSEFLAVYGRRPICKTYLIREVYKQNIIFECSGLHQKDTKQQLENFWLTLIETKTSPKPELPKTWLQAFSLLKAHLSQLNKPQKKVIFLDEIAWFETPRSGFLAALDNFWNQFCSKRDDIVLVICGSAASWIIDKVINNRGGLHNRVTSHIRLLPFTLNETKDFLKMLKVSLTLKDIATLYMAIGGVPYYLKDVKAGQSIAQILDELFFKPQANLKNEFKNLYASLFKNSDLHVAIVKALATKNKGLTRNQLLTATELASGGGFSILLNELVACGFVKIIYPINKTKEDLLYRLIDEFSIFYYKFLINSKANNSWLHVYNTQAYKIWTGYAFENMCFKHILQIKKALGISGIISNEYSWLQKGTQSDSGTQIDFIIDRNDNCINVLELKFYDTIFELTKNYSQQLGEKVQIFKEKNKVKKNVFITLLTANGVKKNQYYLSTITNQLIIDDLFINL
ncbi:MAG: ATP-binding protein [Sphingobacteriales bacterium]|nr:MAG: ATP-binding protein [Sphingobacteriales bacterium]